MTFAAILEFLKAIALAGASPAVQDAALYYLGKMHGHSIEALQKAAAAQRHTWLPKETP